MNIKYVMRVMLTPHGGVKNDTFVFKELIYRRVTPILRFHWAYTRRYIILYTIKKKVVNLDLFINIINKKKKISLIPVSNGIVASLFLPSQRIFRRFI